MTGCAFTVTVPARPVEFTDLPGWQQADHVAALALFRRVCQDARFEDSPPGWAALCVMAARASDPRTFFETAFRPQPREGVALFTGYYEPVVEGALSPGGQYTVPLYAPPVDPGAFARAEIVAGALVGQELELVWLADAAEAFFLQIQGSGRIRLPDGRLLRLGYAGKNGHPYRAIGKMLVEMDEMPLRQVTAQSIKNWLRADPARGAELMNLNPSYVYFRELADLPPEAGPVGALGLPLSAGLSAAVDPAYNTLGLPVWIAPDDAPGAPAPGLWIAMDTGGAIRGPARADLFLGTGEAAGLQAGRLRATGRTVAMVPRWAG